MKQVNLADAKARLNELVARAAAGEPICIMRRGKPVAQLTAVDIRRKHRRIRVAGNHRYNADAAGECARLCSPDARR